MSIPAATDRLIFRHWTIADLQSLHSICSDPAVMQYVGDGEPWSLDRTRLWIEDAIGMSATHRYCRWALASPETTEVIGFCGFVPSDNGAEIG